MDETGRQYRSGTGGRMNASGNRNKGREREEVPEAPWKRKHPIAEADKEVIDTFSEFWFFGMFDLVAEYADQLTSEGYSVGKVQSLMTQGCQGTKHLKKKEK